MRLHTSATHYMETLWRRKRMGRKRNGMMRKSIKWAVREETNRNKNTHSLQIKKRRGKKLKAFYPGATEYRINIIHQLNIPIIITISAPGFSPGQMTSCHWLPPFIGLLFPPFQEACVTAKQWVTINFPPSNPTARPLKVALARALRKQRTRHKLPPPLSQSKWA